MSDFFALLLIAIFGVAAVNIFKDISADPMRHCMTCGTEGETRTHTNGSIIIEIILWLCLIVPGLIYSVWRHTSRREVCRACGSGYLVPIDTPAAARHRRELSAPENN